MIKPYYALIFVLVILAAGVGYYSKHKAGIEGMFVTHPAVIQNIGLEKDMFVVHGQGLSRVELWGIPTGTGVQEAEYFRIGDARLTSANEFGQSWQLPIPKNPLLVTTIFAKGFNEKNDEVGRVMWSVEGATPIYDALWQRPYDNENINEDLSLTLGTQKTVGELTLRVDNVVNDSRCPVDVQCIQAGDVTLNLFLKTPRAQKTFTLKTNDIVTFDRYALRITNVLPVKHSQKEIALSEYTFSVHVDTLAK